MKPKKKKKSIYKSIRKETAPPTKRFKDKRTKKVKHKKSPEVE